MNFYKAKYEQSKIIIEAQAKTIENLNNLIKELEAEIEKKEIDKNK